MTLPLKALIIEDSHDDTLLVVRELKLGGYEPTFERVETADAMVGALDRERWDLIIADYTMPQFSAVEALNLYRKRTLDLPFIVVSGTVSEDAGVEMMVAGANDYISKQNLSRLVPAVHRELQSAEARKERRHTEEALRRSEEKYRSIFENAIEGIFQATPDGRLLSANPALAHIMGFESPEELLTSVTDLADYFPNPGDRAAYGLIIEGQVFVRGFETQVRRRDGSTAWLSLNARAVRDRDGRTLYYEGTTEDITSRKEGEAELLAARERLQSLSRSLLWKLEAERRLISQGLHDDIGRALTAVKVNLQSARHQSRNRAMVSVFLESISLIDKALEQVRSLSSDLRPSILDDTGLVAALRWLVDDKGGSAKLDIEFKADTLPRLPMEIETACFRIAQEAIANAIRYAKAQKIIVNVRIDDKELHLTVCDNGIGFDAIRAQTQAVHNGGIGLLGMQEMAALVEGSISIDSTPGEGSEITVRLPLKEAVR